MIVENIEVTCAVEGGNHIKIIGRSLESILSRRIVWDTTDINGNLQDGLERLFNDAIINPADPSRRIPNFIFQRSTDERITSLTMEHQYTGDDLLTIVQDLTDTNDIGWKIVINDYNQFVFSLYVGTNRSYTQDVLPYVVFRPSYENVISSTYTETGEEAKTITLVAGEDRQFSVDASEETLSMDEKETIRITRVVGSGYGLFRRELYTDARDIQKEEEMSEEEYFSKLDERGIEKLRESSIKMKFDGQYETQRQYVYGRDFFMGDTVQVADDFGHEAPSKIIEFIFSHSTSGFESYPTFRAYEYNE
jgi:hypothetical protein